MSIEYKDGETFSSFATGIYSTHYKADAEALKTAATEISSDIPRAHKNIVIFSDALSELHALCNYEGTE